MKILRYFPVFLVLTGCLSWFSNQSEVPDWLPEYQSGEINCGRWTYLPDEIKRRKFIAFDPVKGNILAAYWLRSGRMIYALDPISSSGDVERDPEHRFNVDPDERVVAALSFAQNTAIVSLLAGSVDDSNRSVIIVRNGPKGEARKIEPSFDFDEVVHASADSSSRLQLLLRHYTDDGITYRIATIDGFGGDKLSLRSSLTIGPKDTSQSLPLRIDADQSYLYLSYVSGMDRLVLRDSGGGGPVPVFKLTNKNEEIVDFEFGAEQGMLAWGLTTRDEGGATISRLIAQPGQSGSAMRVSILETDGREILTPKVVSNGSNPMLLGVYQELGESHIVGFELDRQGASTIKRYMRKWAGEMHVVAASPRSDGGYYLHLSRRYRKEKDEFFCVLP